MRQYHYLVAGLPDISLDDSKLQMSYTNFMEELLRSFPARDAELLRLFRLDYDNENLLSWISDKEAVFHSLGVISPEDLKEQTELLDYDERAPLKGIPPYFLTFLREWKSELLESGKEKKRLTELYYDYVRHTSNKFVREWFEFELNLNNILTALNCRKYNLPVAGQIIGNNAVTESLKISTVRDFNVSGLFSKMDNLLNLADEENLLEREKMIDRIKWDYLDEHSVNYYFSVEVLLVFLIKLKSLERWLSLDPKVGEENFRSLVSSLRNSINMPADAHIK
jgi:vacuolar-type H+-ATPase subunit C/Vma6